MATPQRDRENPGARRATAPKGGSALSYERIALRAYEIWIEAGCPHGEHEEHWYRAERELRAKR